MHDAEIFHAITIGSSVSFGVYAVATYFSNTEFGDDVWCKILDTIPFFTQSIGVMWPLSAFLLLCSIIFEGAAQTQGLTVPEAAGFNAAVLSYSGWLTLLFVSPLLAYFTGMLCRRAFKSDKQI